MSIKLQQLRYFVAVADAGQVTRAAAILHIAQPALSQAIANLEKELALLLFERNARGVTLTVAGQTFYAKARTALLATDDVALTAEALRRADGRSIAFGFIGAPPQLHFPELISSIVTAQPEATINYRELGFPIGATRDWLREIDVAYCYLPPADPDVWARALRSEPRVLLAPSSHPIARKEKISVAEALDATFIGLHSSVSQWWRGFWCLDDHRGTPPLRETDDNATNAQELFAAVASRRAITTVPACQAALLTKVVTSIKAIALEDAAPAVLGLIGRKDRLNQSIAALIVTAESLDDRALSNL